MKMVIMQRRRRRRGGVIIGLWTGGGDIIPGGRDIELVGVVSSDKLR